MPPEADARYFTPHFTTIMNAEMRRFRERPPELQPTIDALEVFLVELFLRRYITYSTGLLPLARHGRSGDCDLAGRAHCYSSLHVLL